MVRFVGVPIRTCIGCGHKRPKEELIRLGVDVDGNLKLDVKGKQAGRGSYVCHDPECIKSARKSARLARIFGRPVPDSVFRELENLVAGSYREPDGG